MNSKIAMKSGSAAVLLGVALTLLWLSVPALGQTTVTKSGVVVSDKPPVKNSPVIDLASFDFRNHTYPDPSRTETGDGFKLVNGTALNGRIALRKTYFFEITRDDNDEAVSLILDSVCAAGCEEAARFYVHSAGEKQPELIFRFAAGSGFSCGLKSADFSVNKIAIEIFGECELKNEWIASPVKTSSKTGSRVTRFVFDRSSDGVWTPPREVRTGASVDLNEFRPKISFGEAQ